MGFVSTCNPDLKKEYLLVLYLFFSEIISSLGQLCCFSERKLNLCILFPNEG